ncbi:MAG: prepilin-type N-terminal cleavage/methylation domain-containing protein [Gammaproteobacteria bacterium]|nr:prepilin-type N-terminal cleavage/methylation domain-containing protein [Gammaproteobacteria bacterium]MBU2056835.1 prepilin-type N-terminal cleavage/methylation domain-containing protein [Gammaproteobacteria bacterium]MBU2174633.1 prepilin-type N-terminal cleavage/methylation domain-containing protein [Gammaproteobacteria bacterium]MBU2248326.1 prepilin-type N-terminal cleavage/methylation domain-containing protein [Gammaproteobacteria bacterium]MBU2346195.1 prepilin-type N-terminal cleavag
MRRQSGFTIIEIIIVVIILGLLAATALPRFLDVVDDAEDASLEGVTGGFATAVGLVRGQWEVAGRPSGSVASGSTGALQANLTFVTVDNRRIGVDASTAQVLGGFTRGYPTAGVTTAATAAVVSGTANNTQVANMTEARCLEVFNLLLQNPPAAIVGTGATAATLAQNKFVVVEGTNTAANICFYFQTAGMAAVPAASAAATNNVPAAVTGLNYFWYNPATGVVNAVRNKA